MSTIVQVNGIPVPRVVVGESGSKIVGLLITGGSGSVPTTVTIANEASDTTCFPLFVTAATGDLGPKTNTGLTFNSSTGVLGATGFSGPLIGNVTGDVSGSSGSCTGNAATATLASTVTVVDGSDATSFVCIFDSATGSLAPKTDAKLTYDATTGVLTSGGYTGSNVIITSTLETVLPISIVDSEGSTHVSITEDIVTRDTHSGSGNVGSMLFYGSAPSGDGASSGVFAFYPGPGTDAAASSGNNGGSAGCVRVGLRTGGEGDGAGDDGDDGNFEILSLDGDDAQVASLFKVEYGGTVYVGTNTLTLSGNAVLPAGTALVNGGALGTPSSGTVTNLTGTASININGTVGATTPTTGVFTTLVAGSTTSLLLGTAGSAVGNIGFRNATSGTATLAPPTGALGTYTVTLPNAASTLPIFGQQITFSGPTAARTVTFPDANFTAARTDAANTFTGVQTFSSAPTSPGSGANTERWGSSAATSTATNATAVGNGASVSGDYGTAVGRASSASTGAVAIGGFATASGTRSFCLAYNSTASHQDAYVFGSNGGVSYQNAGFTFHAASGAPAFFFTSYDDTSVEEMAGFTTAWATSTHASRKGRITISAFDTAAREGIRVEASGSAPMLGFYGTAAVAQQGTYTITAAPAVATALDCDANGGAYSGVPGALGDAATLVDLNNLRADVASLAAVVRQLIKHLGDTSGVGLVNETSY